MFTYRTDNLDSENDYWSFGGTFAYGFSDVFHMVLGYNTIKTEVKKAYSSIKSKVEQIYVAGLGPNAVKTAKEIFLRFCLHSSNI